MTSLADVALAFCRECLGWRMPVNRRFAEQNRNATGDGGSKAWSPYIFDGDAKHDQFHYTDLNAVMEAVRRWCDQQNAVVETSCAKGSILARVRLLRLEGEPYWQHCETLEAALLAACVEAARKLKGEA